MMKRNNDGNEKNCHHNLEDSLDYSFVIHHKDEMKSQIEFKRYIYVGEYTVSILRVIY